MRKGSLYIVSAPSGTGKTSLLGELIKSLDNIVVAVSHTTRLPRQMEKDGKNYFFIDTKTFQKYIEQGDFLEHAEVFGNYYGTSKKLVDKLLAEGKDVILEIDWQGARTVRKIMPNVISIFILPSSIDVLKVRLSTRGQDSNVIIAKRMQSAKSDISHCAEYHYVVINDDFTVALKELQAIIIAERLTLKRQRARYGKLLDRLTEDSE